MLRPQERVVVSASQLNSRNEVLLDGHIISIEGSFATVAIDGEPAARQVPLSTVTTQDALYGDNLTGHPNEMPIIDAIRR